MHKRETRWGPDMRVETCAHSSRVTGRAEGVAHGHRGSSQARSVSLPATVLSCGLGEREMRSDVAGNVWRPLFYVIAQRIGTPTNMFATSFHLSPPISIVVSI